MQRRREELEAQWAWLVQAFQDVVALARDRGEDFLSFRWVTSRAPLVGADGRRPALQEVECASSTDPCLCRWCWVSLSNPQLTVIKKNTRTTQPKKHRP